MMKKENIIYILFPLFFVFYFFQMKGHIGFWEESNFFLLDGDYLSKFIVKPGGWSEYVGNFVLQFYKWRFVGALVLTLVPLAVFIFTRQMIRKLQIPSNWLIIGLVPCLIVWGMQCAMGVGLSEILKIFFFYFCLWGYIMMSKSWMRYLVFSLLFPFTYLLLSTGGCVFLYLTFAVYEFVYGKERYRFAILVFWGLLLSVWPSLWQRWVYLMPGKELYTLSAIKDGESFNPVYILLYVYGLILLVTAWWSKRIKKTGRRFFYICELVLIVVGCVFGYIHFYQQDSEYLFRVDQAAQQEEWEEVLKIAAKVKEPCREELYYVGLALACRGEIGDKLFDYPVWGIGCLYLPRDYDYMTGVFGSEFYYRLKIPNEALHWTLQASIASPLGMNFRTLKRLVDISIQKGDDKMASKYLAILERSMLNGAWIQERRAMMKDPKTERILSQENIDFFIGGRPFLSDMARVMDGGRNLDMTFDYILCGLLLNKDLNKFYQMFTHFYPTKTGKRVPKAYEEALLVVEMTGGKQDVSQLYRISPETRKAFEDFNVLMRNCGKDKKSAEVVMKAFKNTWWYYYHFGKQKLMDVQGRMVGDIQLETSSH